jgi:hypothetical protein
MAKKSRGNGGRGAAGKRRRRAAFLFSPDAVLRHAARCGRPLSAVIARRLEAAAPRFLR